MSDYIKREELLARLNKTLSDCKRCKDDDTVFAYTIQGVITTVKEIPAADVRENVRGEWINICNYDRSMGTNYNRWMCSCCGFRAKHGWEHTRTGRCTEYNYCPNCGAGMKTYD